jgi:micrococcal nuclease
MQQTAIKLLIIMAAAYAVFSLHSVEAADYAYVERIVDGDTIKIQGGKTIRYIGVDSPEFGQPFYGESKEFNRKLVEGKKIMLEYDMTKFDDHNRILAYVYTPDGKCVNVELVRNGYAYVYPHAFETMLIAKLLDAQRYAMDRNLGIFKLMLKETASYYKGSRKGMRFHRPDCAWAQNISKKNLIIFHSKREAYQQGYAPCRRCLP